jgi:glyoxylase-like metal-dependent hydrolase (beta-lactamase superfamily II)
MLKIDYIRNSFFDSMTWLLSETESNQVWIVDCGDVEPILEKIGNSVIAGVLLTHAHFDHIYGLPELIERFPTLKIYTNEIGQKTLADAKLNMSLYHETPLTVEGPQVQICDKGDIMPLFRNVTAEIYETPGHHPSCLTYLVGNYIFTGDAYIPGIKVVTNLPKGDKNEAQESMLKILRLAEGKRILPGHYVRDEK